MLNVQLAALSLASLCITTVILLIREADLEDASGDENSRQVVGAGLSGNTMGGAEQVRSGQSIPTRALMSMLRSSYTKNRTTAAWTAHVKGAGATIGISNNANGTVAN